MNDDPHDRSNDEVSDESVRRDLRRLRVVGRDVYADWDASTLTTSLVTGSCTQSSATDPTPRNDLTPLGSRDADAADLQNSFTFMG